ncbi:MAG TPA: riboflavin synthase [bacterium]|nr:riboflavin synthase [bacterium]
MFTGLIQEVGIVAKAEKNGPDLKLSLEAPRLAQRLKMGDSLAVNGCCLTAVEFMPPLVVFQAVPETLKRTVLGLLKKGDEVNLELPLTLSEPLGGHFVQGHVDGVGQILSLESEGEGSRMKVRIPEALTPYVVEKGSIALDGISLTVAEIHGDEVEIALIPHTLKNTCLRSKRAGDYLHVEVDMLAKYVEKLVGGYLPLRKEL